MPIDNDILVVDGEFSSEYEIKRSRFIASVKGEVDALSAEAFVKLIKKKYNDATHNCYAYITSDGAVRFFDDGEPGGTAGAPILEVLKRQSLTNTALVVTRYFGGIKLGAAGLAGAYARSAAQGISASKIYVKTRAQNFSVECEFSDYARMESLLKGEYIKVSGIDYGSKIIFLAAVTLAESNNFLAAINEISKGRAKLKALDLGYIKNPII